MTRLSINDIKKIKTKMQRHRKYCHMYKFGFLNCQLCLSSSFSHVERFSLNNLFYWHTLKNDHLTMYLHILRLHY